jgi:DNA-binding response OmpR family regulator
MRTLVFTLMLAVLTGCQTTYAHRANPTPRTKYKEYVYRPLDVDAIYARVEANAEARRKKAEEESSRQNEWFEQEARRLFSKYPHLIGAAYELGPKRFRQILFMYKAKGKKLDDDIIQKYQPKEAYGDQDMEIDLLDYINIGTADSL